MSLEVFHWMVVSMREVGMALLDCGYGKLQRNCRGRFTGVWPLCYGFCIRDFSVVTFILGFSLKLDIGDAKLWSLKSGGVRSTYSGVHVLEVFWSLYSGT